jgi:hypothetical protein
VAGKSLLVKVIAAHHSFPYLHALFILLRCDKRNSGTSFIITAPSTVISKFILQIFIPDIMEYLIILIFFKLVVEPIIFTCKRERTSEIPNGKET